MRFYYLVLLLMFLALRCSPVNRSDFLSMQPRTVDYASFQFRPADDGSKVYWSVNLENRLDAWVTITVQLSVQVLASQDMASLQAEHGAEWKSFLTSAKGAEWASQEPAIDVNLSPKTKKLVRGEILLPPKYKGQRMFVVNKTAMSSEGFPLVSKEK